MSQTAYARGPLSSQSYTLPHGVEYYNNGSGNYSQQINYGYSTSYSLAQQNMIRSELIPVQMQQMQTSLGQEPPNVDIFPAQQMQQGIEMAPMQTYSQSPTPTSPPAPPLKQRRPDSEPCEPERAAVPQYEPDRECSTPEPDQEPEIIERVTIREKVKTVCQCLIVLPGKDI
jgi:hypothetical protein